MPKVVCGSVLAIACFAPTGLAYAYTDAGDRLFPVALVDYTRLLANTTEPLAAVADDGGSGLDASA